MIKIKIKEAAEILNAQCIGNCDCNKYICGVSIDSRSVCDGNLFVPIKGMKSDGHSYVKDAVKSGAAATLWNKNEPNPPEDIPVILVDDTIKSLQDLSYFYRNKLKAKFVGITGSNGKTSTKDITASILSQRFKTQKTMGNYNTEIGVPYTLLSLDEDCEVAVIEMGMEKAGEIDFLTHLVQPDVGIITSVGLVHIDKFPSIEEIAKEKVQISNGIKDKGLFIYFGDDSLIRNTVNNSEIKISIRRQTFGTKEFNTLYLKSFSEDLNGITFTVNDERFGELHADILGKHQALNSMAAILAAEELGMTPEEIRFGLIKIEKTGLRNEIIKVNKCTILNDCYKSNPVSISAALEIFELIKSQRKVVVLGDMLGYREMSHDMHYNVGKNLASHNIDELVTIGHEAKYMAKGARENTNIQCIKEFDTKEEATEYLKKYLEEDCSILIKGSRFLKLEYIAATLNDWRKLMKTRLAIMFGGKSDEYSVSLHSAAAIIRNVPEELFDVTLVGITKEGKWFLYEENVDKIDEDTWYKEKMNPVLLNMGNDFKGLIKLNEDDGTFAKIELDCVFPVLHGKNGEDGTIQGLCQMAGVPFVGCGMTSSAVGMDKEFTHAVCEYAGVKTAPFITAINNSGLNIKKLYDKAGEKLSLPLFIKPANNGSSLGISKVRNYDEFEKGIMEAFQYDSKVVIEKAIGGFEIGCAVVGNDELIIGEVDEIDTKNDFFDNVEKYSQHNSKIYCPARISDDLKEKAKQIAGKTYKALGCKGMARVDMFLSPENEIYLNEINTIPGLTDVSRYPAMLKNVGIEYRDLIVKLVELAMENTDN